MEYVSNIVMKLGATSGAEAVVLAVRRGQVNWPGIASPNWPIPVLDS